jgi:hypothetical protein
MLAFDLLGVAFANGMRNGRQMPLIAPSSIRVEVRQAKGLEQLLQLHKDRIRSTAEGICEDYATQMINRMP